MWMRYLQDRMNQRIAMQGNAKRTRDLQLIEFFKQPHHENTSKDQVAMTSFREKRHHLNCDGPQLNMSNTMALVFVVSLTM